MNNLDDLIIKISKNMLNPDILLNNLNKDMPNKEPKVSNLSIDLASGIPGLLYLANELHQNYNISNADTHIDDFISTLLTTLKHTPPYDISLFAGLPGIAIALASLKRKDLSNIIEQLNQSIYQLINYFINQLNSNFVNQSSTFDIMYGLSGTLHYLCFYTQISKKSNALKYIKKIQDFFINHYTKNINIANFELFPWYISNKDLSDDLERKNSPFGNYNISMSHGISGILLALSESQKIHYSRKVFQLQKHISNFILKNMTIIDNFPIWPLTLEIDNNYHIKKNQPIARFDSWCYGSPGTLLAPLDFADQENYTQLKSFCIKNIISLNNTIVGINSPIVCHGYAGVLMTLLFTKRKYNLSFSINKNISKKILSYRDPKLKLGFLDKRYIDTQTISLVPDAGILNGTSGILLSLMLLNYNSKSNWTKLFAF